MVALSQKTTFTAIEVDAMATQRALKLALETGFHQIILEGNSQILISDMENSSDSLSNIGHIVKGIQYITFYFSKIHYSHVRRHCNTVAHSLVKRAISFSQMQIWMEDASPDIIHVLQVDLNCHS